MLRMFAKRASLMTSTNRYWTQGLHARTGGSNRQSLEEFLVKKCPYSVELLPIGLFLFKTTNLIKIVQTVDLLQAKPGHVRKLGIFLDSHKIVQKSMCKILSCYICVCARVRACCNGYCNIQEQIIGHTNTTDKTNSDQKAYYI